MSELTPPLRQRFFDANGAPLAGGKVYTYSAGTTTPLATYTDQTGVTPNTNPVILDASGYADIWMGDNSYKFVVTDSNDVSIFTVDNVQSIATQIAAAVRISPFHSVVVSYTQLQAAALSNAIQLFSLPANTVLKDIVIKHSTLFTGTGISTVVAEIGPSGNYTEFINDFDIKQAVGDAAYDNATTNYIGSFASPTPIYLNAVATGANLSALTQGALTVYYSYDLIQ